MYLIICQKSTAFFFSDPSFCPALHTHHTFFQVRPLLVLNSKDCLLCRRFLHVLILFKRSTNTRSLTWGVFWQDPQTVVLPSSRSTSMIKPFHFFPRIEKSFFKFRTKGVICFHFYHFLSPLLHHYSTSLTNCKESRLRGLPFDYFLSG